MNKSKNLNSKQPNKETLKNIDDEYYLKLYKNAIKKYINNPITYTHEEVKKILDLNT